MDLAERIINGDNDLERDDLGLPLPLDANDPSVEYMGQRIMKLNPHIYRKEDGHIYLGKTAVRETAAELVRLSNVWNSYGKGAKHMLVWNYLRETLPLFDDTKLWIGPTLLWNMKTGELEEQKPQENYV